MMQRFAWLAVAGLLWIPPTIAQTAFTPRDESPQDFPAGLGRDEVGSPWSEGQSAVYMKDQLQTFASGQRRNDISQQMRNIAAR